MGDFRNSWDYQIVFPFVRGLLVSRAWPALISITAICDAATGAPELSNHRILRLEQDIARALNDCGYCRVSAKGGGFVRIFPGIQTIPDPGQFREIPAICFSG